MPNFALHAPLPPAAQEGGGIDAMKRKTKKKKRSSDAWVQIQKQNFAYSNDTYILQSQENQFNIDLDVEVNEQLFEEENFSSEDEAELEEEEEEEAGEEENRDLATPDNQDEEEEEFFSPATPGPSTQTPKTPARPARPTNLDQLLFGRLTRSPIKRPNYPKNLTLKRNEALYSSASFKFYLDTYPTTMGEPTCHLRKYWPNGWSSIIPARQAHPQLVLPL